VKGEKNGRSSGEPGREGEESRTFEGKEREKNEEIVQTSREIKRLKRKMEVFA
jgi:hypothetical protein